MRIKTIHRPWTLYIKHVDRKWLFFSTPFAYTLYRHAIAFAVWKCLYVNLKGVLILSLIKMTIYSPPFIFYIVCKLKTRGKNIIQLHYFITQVLVHQTLSYKSYKFGHKIYQSPSSPVIIRKCSDIKQWEVYQGHDHG